MPKTLALVDNKAQYLRLGSARRDGEQFPSAPTSDT